MSTVFRHYDQAALDREYDNRAKVADFADFLARYRAASDTLRRQRPGQELAYGPPPAARLDIFPPLAAPPGAAPVHVFIHGGYWKSLGKHEFAFTAGAAPEALTVVLDYPLIPTVDMDTLVAHCRQALIWLYRHIADHGGDPRRIVVSGHSAGGHLAALLLASDWPALDPGLPADPVRAILGLSGLYDLEPIRRCFLNAELHLDGAAVAEHSPLNHLPPVGTTALLAVGEQEGHEYARQSRVQVEAWIQHIDARVLLTPDHHFSIVSQLERPDTPLARRLQTLLEGTAHATGPL